MKRPEHRRFSVSLLILAALLLAGCPGYSSQQVDKHYLTVFGHRGVMQPGAEVELPILLRTTRSDSPVPGGEVSVRLGPSADTAQAVFSGTTDTRGMVTARFAAPRLDDPRQFLIITSKHTGEEATYSREVTLGAGASVMVSTDKPVYQPGQIVHVRVLALDSLALKPAGGQSARLQIRNPQDIALVDQALPLSTWGIGSLDLELDSQAATGNYQISAEVGGTEAQRTVEVKPYTLPRFEVKLTTDRPYYPVDGTISGRVEAAYFFGKPVAGGQVRIEGVTGRNSRGVLSLEGVTDDAGVYAFSFPVPDYYFDRLEQGTEDLDLTVTVADTAQHEEVISDEVLISADSLRIEAIPESGYLRPGLDNIVYLQVSEPDGTPIQADLGVKYNVTEVVPAAQEEPASAPPPGPAQTSRAATPAPVRTRVTEQTETVTTDPDGLATVRIRTSQITDLPVTITARAGDRRATRTVNLGTVGSRTDILLRPERAEYRAGETIRLQVLASPDVQTAYLDLAKDRQTVDFRTLDLRDGSATAQVTLDGSLLGTLELHAYGITASGALAHDRRLVLVNPPPADIAVKADAEAYRPGDTARLSLDVSLHGEPAEAALGVSIVDESVFSLGGHEPGFIRTYFLLQKELTERRYGIKGFAPFDGDAPPQREFEGIQLSADRALMGAMAQVLAETEAEALAAARSGASHDAGTTPGADRLAGGLAVLPLLGLALYGGRRRGRWLLAALVAAAVAGGLTLSCGAPPAAPAVAPGEAPGGPPAAAALPVSAPVPAAEVEAAPRLRQFFPETLYWLPELVTDRAGHAEIAVPIADNITTWRVSVVASTRDGTLGSAQMGLRVFQDFFIEPELPARLTQNDRIDLPVTVYNYLDEPQEVQLSVEPDGWFTVASDRPAQTLALAANEVAVARVPIQVLQPGQHTLTFTARGRAMSDAVARQVVVVPDGRRQVRKAGGTVARSAEEVIALPQDVLTGTARVAINLYPSEASQLELGVDNVLYWSGCPTSDFNVALRLALITRYLKESGNLTPEQQIRSEHALRLAYQRLLRYRDPATGGFAGRCCWFTRAPADVAGTATALRTLAALGRVIPVDPALLDRAAQFMADRQQPDGTWRKAGDTSEEWPILTVTDHTAAMAWALSEAGLAKSETTQRALDYVHSHKEEGATTARYAELANALLLANSDDPLARELIETLLGQAPVRNGERFWGRYSLDDTALVLLALVRAGGYADEAQQALAAINAPRQGWHPYLSDRGAANLAAALIEEARRRPADATGEVTVRLNQQPIASYEITPENRNVARQAVLTGTDAALQPGDNRLQLRIDGGHAMRYQVTTEYYLPWPETTPEAALPDELALAVQYPDQPAQLDSTVVVTATVTSNLRESSGPVILELAIPAGFDLVWDDWSQLVSEKVVRDYQSRDGQTIQAYLDGLEPGAQVTFTYRLWARVPGSVRAPASRIYQEVAPAAGTEAGSGQMLVTE